MRMPDGWLTKEIDISVNGVYIVVTVCNADRVYKGSEATTMADKSYPGEFEQMVLLAILQLKDGAYASEVARELERSAGRTVSRGALYTALDRLQRKRMVRWSIEGATSERGGYPKRRFEVTENGVEALRLAREALMNLWRGLDEVLAREGR